MIFSQDCRLMHENNNFANIAKHNHKSYSRTPSYIQMYIMLPNKRQYCCMNVFRIYLQSFIVIIHLHHGFDSRKNVERVNISEDSNLKTIRYFFLFIDVAYNFDSDDGNACVKAL